MKMIMMAYNEALDEKVMELLHTCLQAEYTKWTKVLGWGQHSEPHLLNHDWPKANNVLMACVDDERAAKIMAAIREERKTQRCDGLKAFSMPVDDVT